MNHEYITENNKLKESIIKLLNSNSIEFFIQHRVKSVDSYQKKLETKQKDKNFTEITDISGIRIILNRVSEMRNCIELMVNTYDTDYNNSNFNYLSFINPNEFGYSSSHIIINTNNIKTEVQIRTLSQHIWGITYHNLSYKSQSKNSLFERKLFRLSGLLEQVDVLIEDIYESRPISTGMNYDTLKILDYYSLEYFLSRKERIFSLVNICFERKKSGTNFQKHPFSMKILDGGKAYNNNNKSSMDLILIACTHLKIDSPQKLKNYLIDKKNNAKLIRKKFADLDLSSEATSPSLRLFLFLVNDIPFLTIKKQIENIVHPNFLKEIKIYINN